MKETIPSGALVMLLLRGFILLMDGYLLLVRRGKTKLAEESMYPSRSIHEYSHPSPIPEGEGASGFGVSGDVKPITNRCTSIGAALDHGLQRTHTSSCTRALTGTYDPDHSRHETGDSEQ
jgi:hypothetical protein